jgi:hypothetical protein
MIFFILFTLWLSKWFVADFFGYGWEGYGKFSFYFSAICYVIAFIC